MQTPLHGAAPALRVGDRVWMRHAKAGELCERFNELHLVRGDELVETVPTYRGEGKAFLCRHGQTPGCQRSRVRTSTSAAARPISASTTAISSSSLSPLANAAS